MFFYHLLALACASVRGVAPGKQHLYVPDSNGKWRCLLDKSIVLDFDQLNDNVCDCPDGLDEPGTAACPYTREQPHLFYCENNGFVPGYLENFKVGDGVCDYDVCCDGSDEPGVCENKCSVVAQHYNEFVEEKKANIAIALERKEVYLEKAKQSKAARREQLTTLEQETAQIASSIEELKQKLALADDSEDGVVVVQELIESLRAARDSYRAQNARLELLLEQMARNYNPNFNDQAVKHAIGEFQNYVANKPDSVDDNEDVASLLNGISKTATEPSIIGLAQHYYSKVFGSTPKPMAPKTGPSRATKKITAQIEKLEKELRGKQSEVSIVQLQEHSAYGDLFGALERTWATTKLGEYNYKVGPFDSVYQDGTLVGRFEKMEDNTMFFSHGTKCWNGPHRSAVVDLRCGSDMKIVSVSEPEKCQYRFVLETPVVCEEMSDEEIGRTFKVDILRVLLL